MCFKIGRVRVKISFLFFAVLTLFFVFDSNGLALITFVSVALHELGHILALLCFGSAPDELCFGIFGVRIQQNKYILSDFQQAVVVACGPLTNTVLFVGGLVANAACHSPILLIFSSVNLVMSVFNLLPILPLDGGRILCIILNIFLSKKTAQKIMRAVCVVMLFGLILSGVFLVLKTGFNVSLLATGAYICLLCVKSIRIGY